MRGQLLYSGPDDIPRVLARLTDRDRTLVDLLGRHRVLTIDQIQRIAFHSLRSTRRRLADLMGYDVITRFRGLLRPGSQAYRYTLGYTGAVLHAATTDQPLPTRTAWREHLARLTASPTLGHRIGVNDFFCRIIGATRTRPDWTLTEWLSEAETWDLTGGMIRPDAAATIHHNGTTSIWFEHDTDTETLHRVVAKVDRYAQLLTGHHRVLALELTGPVREANFLAAVGDRSWPLPIATTITARAADPTGPVWRLVGKPGLWHMSRLPSQGR